MKNSFYNLIANLEFWYAKHFIKLDKHYTFFLDLNGDPGSFAIKLLKKYEGVIIEFANIKVGDNGQLTFDYDIISNVNNCNVKSRKFERFTQNVMRSMIYGAVNNLEKDLNENRKPNIVEPSEKRSVHAKGTSVSEEGISKRKSRKKTVRRNKKLHSEIQQSTSDSSAGDKS